MVKVLYFGIAGEVTGIADEYFSAETTGGLLSQIKEKYPGLCSVTFRLALNNCLIIDDCSLKEGDRIAVLPPFAGG